VLSVHPISLSHGGSQVDNRGSITSSGFMITKKKHLIDTLTEGSIMARIMVFKLSTKVAD
jgi:hypothetical protein